MKRSSSYQFVLLEMPPFGRTELRVPKTVKLISKILATLAQTQNARCPRRRIPSSHSPIDSDMLISRGSSMRIIALNELESSKKISRLVLQLQKSFKYTGILFFFTVITQIPTSFLKIFSSYPTSTTSTRRMINSHFGKRSGLLLSPG